MVRVNTVKAPSPSTSASPSDTSYPESQHSCPGPPPSVYHCSAVVGHVLYVLLGLRAHESIESTDEGNRQWNKRSGREDLVYAFDMETDQWSVIDPCLAGNYKDNVGPGRGRCLASCVTIGKLVYVFGGYQIASGGSSRSSRRSRHGSKSQQQHKVFNGMYTFDTEKHVWNHLSCSGLSPDPRAGASMVYHGGRLWVYGGSQGRHVFFGDMFSFDLSTNTWQVVEMTKRTEEEEEQMHEIDEGRDHEVYSPDVGDVVLPGRRTCHTAAMVGKHHMFVFGGLTCDDEYKRQRVTSDLFCFDMRTMQWSKLRNNGDAPSARCCHASIALDKILLVACGGDMVWQRSDHSSNSIGSSSFGQGFGEFECDYDNRIFAYHTEKGQWTKLRGIGVRGLPHCMGLSMDYDPSTRRLLLFGGKLISGTPLNQLYMVSGTTFSGSGFTTGINSIGDFARALFGKKRAYRERQPNTENLRMVAESAISSGKRPESIRRQSIVALGLHGALTGSPQAEQPISSEVPSIPVTSHEKQSSESYLPDDETHETSEEPHKQEGVLLDMDSHSPILAGHQFKSPPPSQPSHATDWESSGTVATEGALRRRNLRRKKLAGGSGIPSLLDSRRRAPERNNDKESIQLRKLMQEQRISSVDSPASPDLEMQGLMHQESPLTPDDMHVKERMRMQSNSFSIKSLFSGSR